MRNIGKAIFQRIITVVFLLISFGALGQTTIMSDACSAATSGWTYTNNVTTQAIQQSGYQLLQASGSTKDEIITANIDVSGFTDLVLTLQVATYGSGTNNPAKIEYSTDGGSSWSTTTFTTNTPTSSTYIASGDISIGTQVTTTLKIKFTNNGTADKGVRMKNILLVGTPASSAPVITSSLTASGTVGSAFSYTITATNTPTSYSASGLPAGLSINTSTGEITGTPTGAGVTNVTIGATNGSGSDSQTLVITISAAGSKKILFDGTSGQSDAAADWVVDADTWDLDWYSSGNCYTTTGTESNPQRYPTPAAPTAESDWDGGNSTWAYELYLLGHTIESLGGCQDITYGDGSNPQDLSNYDVFICNEPNVQFTTAEKTAIIAFVNAGGGLYMGADHGYNGGTACTAPNDEADRNCDGWNSTEVWNDLMSGDPFGIQFNHDNTASPTSTNINADASDPILHGTAGDVASISFNQGATMTINTASNATAKAAVFMLGEPLTSSTNIMVAYSEYGSGRVVGVGDSSPTGDATGDTNGETRNNNWVDANNAEMILNATIWLMGGPTITVSTTTLTGFTYVEGAGPSSEQSFTISGSSLTADISITAPTNYEISTGTGGSFVATSPITLTQSGGTVSSTTIYVRLKAGLTNASSPYNGETITASSTGATNKTVTCDGTVTAVATPTITVSTTTLTGFTYVEGAGPSAEQSFTISGSSLTADISITAPTNYEISTGTGGSFVATSPITLTQSGGTVSNTTIYVRLKAGLTNASSPYNSEAITASSTGATDKTVTCDGTVTASGGGGCASDLIISEYHEPTSGNNKGVEIYNGTGSAVDLSSYYVGYIANGGSAVEGSINLTGTLNDGEVACVYNDADADATFRLKGDINITWASATWNGDDAVYLLKGGTANGNIIDAIGDLPTHSDPGTEFTDGTIGTLDAALVRKSSVTSPTTTWSGAEWNDNVAGDYSDWGVHTMSCNTPTITVSTTTLSGFTYTQGSGPSSEQSFTVEGSNLTADITLTPPTNYEISTGTGGSFVATNPITLTQSGGTVSTTTIYVRLKAGLSTNTYNSEDITASSTGATSKTVTCSGEVTAPLVPTLSVSTSTLTGYSYVVGSGPSTSQSFDLSGVNMDGSQVTVSAPTNYEVSTDNSSFSASVNVSYTAPTLNATTIYVRLKAGLSVGTYNSENVTCNDNGTASNVTVANNGEVLNLPAVTLADNGTQVTTADVSQGTTKHILHKISLTVANSDATLNQVNFTTSGTYVATDVTKFQVWYSTTNDISTASTIASDITASLGTGAHSFTGISQAIASGATGYLWITTDVASGATVGNTITVSAIATGDLTFASGTKSGSSSAGGTQTIIVATSSRVFISEFAGLGYLGDFNDEYFELTNDGGSDQDLTGWTLEYYNSTGTLEGGAQSLTGTIAANSAYLIAARTTGGPINGVTPDFVCLGVAMNSTGYVILKDNTSAIIDEAGSSGDKFADGENFEFIDCANDNKPTANWDPLVTGNGTPGVVNCSNAPTITVSTTTLTGFTYNEGSGPSAEQSFTIEGVNLTADITLTPPTDYEISTGTGGGFAATNPITLTQSGGTVSTTTIYVRQKAGLLSTNSPFSGNIACTSTGATTKNVACDGVVVGPTITVSTNTLTGFTYGEGSGPSTEQSFTVEGVVLSSNIVITPPTNFEISTGTGGSFVATNPITLTQSGGTVSTTTIYVRLKAGLLGVNSPFSGNISCTSTGATTENVACDGTVVTPEVNFSVTTASVNEDGVTYTITVNSDVTGSHSVDIALTGGTASNGSEFSYTSPVTATFAGSTTYTTNVTINNDGTCSGASSTAIFTLNNTSVCSVGANGTLTLTINDDDLLSGEYLSQTFESAPGDNWGYAGTGTLASDFNKKIDTKSYRFVLTPDDNFETDNVNITGFTNVAITVYYACTGIDSGDDLQMWVSYDGGTTYDVADMITLITGASNLSLNTTSTASSNKYTLNVAADKTQVRLKIKTKADLGSGEYSYIDNLSMSRTVCNVCSEPTTNSSMTATTSIATTSATLNWTSGDGDARLIAMNTSSISDVPSDNTTYIANAAYGTAGTELGTSYVVYKNASNTTNVTSLSPGTEYYVKMWEYSCLPGTEDYLTTGTQGNTMFVTLPEVPATYSVGCVGNNSVDLSWTAPATGGLTGYMIVARPSVTPTSPVGLLDPSSQTFNTDFSSAPSYGTSSSVVYKGSGTSTTITGLTTGVTYYFSIYTYKIGTSMYQYSAVTTLSQAISMINVTSASGTNGDTQATVNWTNPNGTCFDEILVIVNETSGIGFTPSGDGSAYTANTVYGGVDSEVYLGTGTSVTVTGLTNATTYYCEIFVRNGTEWSSGVEVAVYPNAATILYPADLAIIAVNTSIDGTFGGMTSADEICFIAFKDISDVTAIDFTDNGYNRSTDTYWGDTEGSIRLQRTGGGTISAGTPICFRGVGNAGTSGAFDIYNCGVLDNSNWTISSLNGTYNYDLNREDQIWIMQNGNWVSDQYTGNLLYGWTATGWKTDLGSVLGWTTYGSMLFPGAECFNTSITTGTNDDKVKFVGTLNSKSQSEWIAQINENANWNGYSTNALYDAAVANSVLIDYSGTCINFPISGTIDHSGGSSGIWTGSVSPDWFTCENWEDMIIPNQTTDVVVPATSSNHLIIDDGIASMPEASCHDINLETPTRTTTLSLDHSVLNVYGDFINDGDLNHNLGTVKFVGSESQIISGSSTTTFYNLEVNKTSNHVSLSTDISVEDSLTLTAQNFILGSNNLTIGTNGSIVGNQNSFSFITTDGTGVLTYTDLGLINNGASFFPVGKSTTSFSPITLANLDITPDDYSVRVSNNVLTGGTTGTAETSGVVDVTWHITEAVAGSSSVNAIAQWYASDELTGFDRSNCFISHHNGTSWDSPTGAAATGSDPYTISRNGLTSFSPYSVRSQVTLPIELLSFDAVRDGKYVRANWTTASEFNNDYFTIERSLDAQNFEFVTNYPGAGNSFMPINYGIIDYEPYSEKSYYRLKQTDYDGQFSYSNIVSVDGDSKKAEIEIRQVNNYIQVSINNSDDIDYNVTIVDMLGHTLLNKNYESSDRIVIDINSLQLPTGVYNIAVYSNNSIKTQKLILGN